MANKSFKQKLIRDTMHNGEMEELAREMEQTARRSQAARERASARREVKKAGSSE